MCVRQPEHEDDNNQLFTAHCFHLFAFLSILIPESLAVGFAAISKLINHQCFTMSAMERTVFLHISADTLNGQLQPIRFPSFNFCYQLTFSFGDIILDSETRNPVRKVATFKHGPSDPIL